MATSKMLSNLRNRYRRAARKLEAVAAQQAGPERERLRTEAARLEHLASQSLIGRGGTKEERQKKIESAWQSLQQNKESIKVARSSATKMGLQKSIERRQRQERIFSATRSLAGKGSKEKVLSTLFMMSSRDLWAGAQSPQDRYGMISARMGGQSIGEVYSNWQRDLMTKHGDLINAIHNRDWDTLAESGWTDSEINDAKERLRGDDWYEEAKLISEYTGIRMRGVRSGGR